MLNFALPAAPPRRARGSWSARRGRLRRGGRAPRARCPGGQLGRRRRRPRALGRLDAADATPGARPARPRSVPVGLPVGRAAGAAPHRARSRPVSRRAHGAASTSPPTSSRSGTSAGCPHAARAANDARRPAITEREVRALLRAGPAPVAARCSGCAAPTAPGSAGSAGAPYPFLLPPPYRYGPTRAARGAIRHDRRPRPARHQRRGLRADRAHLSPHKARAYRAVGHDLVQGRREGVRVWDLEGRDYINCRSSGGVFNFGHRPRSRWRRSTARWAEHDMGDWLLPSARRARGAEALARLLPEPLPFTLLHRLGRRGGRGGLQARPLGDRAGRLRVRRAWLPRSRRLLARDGRPPLSDRYQPLDAGDRPRAFRRRRGGAQRSAPTRPR